MKLFSPLTAGVAGTIAEVLIEDAQMVEYDQPIFLVDPSQD
jgi:acetyl-CoA carboxylase biotin carboxyl carrier protein